MLATNCFCIIMRCGLTLGAEDDDDIVVSGWGDVEGMREDLLKDWGDMLERWDGKDRARSSKLIKLCRKVLLPLCVYAISFFFLNCREFLVT